MTVAPPVEPTARTDRAPSRTGARPAGVVPAALAGLVTVLVLRYYGVSWRDLLAFGAYGAGALTLPGALLWRAVRRSPGPLAEDLAAGTAVGIALEVLAYLPARWLGAPVLFLLAPASVLALFAVVPPLRRYWRPERVDTPLWWAWGLSILYGVVLLYCCGAVFRHGGIDVPDYRYADGDLAFHLANIGEIKHHVPPQVPYVLGEPLYYHWFSYADMAATSWATGIEPLVLLRRLAVAGYLAVTVVLIAVLARRLTGRWWTGLVAASSTYLVLAPDPYGWRLHSWLAAFGFGVVDDGSLLRQNIVLSPTQTFGAAIFAALMLVLLDGVRERGDVARVLLFIGLAIVVMGGKATFLPLLAVGLTGVVAVEATWRRCNPFVLVALATTVLGLAYAQIVLFGGSAQGLSWSPLRNVDMLGLRPETGAPRWLALTIAVVALAAVWGAIAALGPGLARGEVVLLLGIGAAGLACSYLLHQDGFSNTFFLQSARPYLCLAAVTGLATAIGGGWRRPWAALGAAGAGVLAVITVRRLGPPQLPAAPDVWALVWPYALLGAFLLGLTLLARVAGGARVAVVAALAAMLGAGAVSGVNDRIVETARQAARTGWYAPGLWGQTISAGALEAGRWLRAHSDPDDIVATNAHCVGAYAPCAALHFEIAGFTERRVLVEGWGYTASANARGQALGVNVAQVPFADPQLLATNDAAFANPSPHTLNALRDRYGVRWLFAESTTNPPNVALLRYAVLRFAAGDCAIYELPGPG